MANNNIEKIDQYLDGELEPQEKASFEQQLANDPQLEEQFKQNLLLREVVDAGYRENMRNNIRKWKSEKQSTSSATNIRKLGARLAAAASVIIIVTASIFGLIVPQYNNSNIASKYYEPEMDLGLIRGSEEVDILRQAFENYQQGNYSGAIPGFQRYPDNDKALYGLGLSFYQVKDFDNAVNSFKTLVDRNNIEYTEKAEFYLLLSYLKADQTGAEFQQLLDKMITEGGYYSGQAERVKKRMESFWRKLL